ncbi:NfeD family protein [Alteromonas flava]|uniref:NfeD family protein n=1 Tax=Alteromonas flava TaxID=2048003 RepID=UPI000C283DE8|nr:NfeD family protein [Alteromonas flava]
MDNMLTNMPHLLLGVGLIFLILEVILGFTTVLLLTLGLSLIITSGLMYGEFLDEDLLHAFIAIAVIDTVLLALLYRPMKKLQQDKKPNAVKSDLIGDTFELDADIGPGIKATQRFSGINWQVKSFQPIARGTTVKITQVEVGLLHVEPV